MITKAVLYSFILNSMLGVLLAVIMFFRDLSGGVVYDLLYYLIYGCFFGMFFGIIMTVVAIVNLRSLGLERITYQAISERLNFTLRTSRGREQILSALESKDMSIKFNVHYDNTSIFLRSKKRLFKKSYTVTMSKKDNSRSDQIYDISFNIGRHINLLSYYDHIRTAESLRQLICNEA